MWSIAGPNRFTLYLGGVKAGMVWNESGDWWGRVGEHTCGPFEGLEDAKQFVSAYGWEWDGKNWRFVFPEAIDP